MSRRAARHRRMGQHPPVRGGASWASRPAPPARGTLGGARITSRPGPGWQTVARQLALWALVIEAFLLALYVVAPLGGVSLSISPLASAWPWLLAPARLVFGSALVGASIPPAQGWAQLALLAMLLVGASCAAGAATLLALRVERSADRRWLWLTLGVAAALGLTLALLPALPSDDVFSYILYGRISALHHANPLVATPANFPSDPFLSLVYWQNTRSVYGPVWLLLSGALSQLAQALGGGLVIYVALFKLLGLLTHLANATLIWLILGQIAPRRRLAGTLLYAWNPLCLVEFCASAHNDALMLFFLLLGVYAFVRKQEALGLVAIALSIQTKIVPIALIPFYLVYCARRLRAAGASWREVAWGLGWRIGLVALVALAVIAPFWAGPQTFGALLFSPPAQQLDNSLLEAISWPLRWLAQGALGLSVGQARSVVETTLKLLALAVFGLLWLWEMRRTRTLDDTFSAWGWALVWYALIASGWFWPWYVTWVIAVAAFAPWGRLQVVAQLLAGGVLTLYGFLPLQAAGAYGYRSLIAFGPALIYLLYQLWRGSQEGGASWSRLRMAALGGGRSGGRSGGRGGSSPTRGALRTR